MVPKTPEMANSDVTHDRCSRSSAPPISGDVSFDSRISRFELVHPAEYPYKILIRFTISQDEKIIHTHTLELVEAWLWYKWFNMASLFSYDIAKFIEYFLINSTINAEKIAIDVRNIVNEWKRTQSVLQSRAYARGPCSPCVSVIF